MTNTHSHTLGEFEELVLLMVAAHHDQAYGVLILESLEEKLKKKYENGGTLQPYYNALQSNDYPSFSPCLLNLSPEL